MSASFESPSRPLPLREYARAIVETVRAPLLVLDEAFVIVSANPAFVSRYGRPAESVVGQGFLEIGDGEWDVPELRSALEGVLPEGREVQDLALRLPIGRAGRRDIVLSARRVSLEGEEQNLILVSLEDFTERERYRRRQARYAAELERSNRDLQDFAHAASHDLQEPLRKISIYVDYLGQALDTASLDERAQRYLERLPEATKRLQRRIDDLLQLARVNRAAPAPQETDLAEVAAAVLEDLEVRLSESDAQVEVTGLPVVWGDPAQMRVLFQNLVANALKFTRPGERPVVRIEGGTDGDMHVVTVQDEGIGFEEDHAERIFGAFQRLHGRDEYEGSGVGLAICRRIVEHHHGTITATGEPGRGARFTIRLPTTWEDTYWHDEEEP